jgi:hypothetical protein
MDFYCKVGDIETNTPWLRPNLDTVKIWFADLLRTPGIENYDIWLVGNFAEITFGESNLDTWDVDVVITCDKLKDYSELKMVMDDCIRLGFKHRLLIDVFYNDNLLDLKSFKKIKQIRNFKTFYKKRPYDEYKYEVKGDKVKALPHGLYEITHDTKSKSVIKAYERIQSGEYKGLQLNAREVLN